MQNMTGPDLNLPETMALMELIEGLPALKVADPKQLRQP
jgi:hypothetical protein